MILFSFFIAYVDGVCILWRLGYGKVLNFQMSILITNAKSTILQMMENPCSLMINEPF